MSLEEIKAREAAATEGPWGFLPSSVSADKSKWNPASVVADGGVDPWGEANGDYVVANASDEDAEFIAHAREDIPKLLQALNAIDVYCLVADMKVSEIRSDKIRQLVTEALR